MKFYVIDRNGFQQEDSTGKIYFEETVEACEHAISFYRDMDYPGFPYSIVDAATGEVISIHRRDEDEDGS